MAGRMRLIWKIQENNRRGISNHDNITGRKILNITISGSFIISSQLLYTISTLDSSAYNTEGHIKLIDRLSSPSDRLIHHISHPSKKQMLAEPNSSYFICIKVNGFTTCNPHFCKRGSHTVNGPSEVSTQK